MENEFTDKFPSSKRVPFVHSEFKVVINNQNVSAGSSNVNINNNILVINKISPEKSINNSNAFDMEDLNSPKRRCDVKGNEIDKNIKKHGVTFIDKITKKRFVDVVDIESFKEFNIPEDIEEEKKQKNSCCVIV